jgi:dihydrofolate synthase/folylpolyglutamate synthase
VNNTFDRLFALETFGIKLGLDNITRLCDALGHPERKFPTIHVAGTNGKGSVTAMTHAALIASGVRAARYTSPHLCDLTERFVIGRDPVDEQTLAQVTADVIDCVDRLREERTLSVMPTFFEVTTAVAFELFSRARVDAAVIEVGLGGRFDATNVITPVATAITTIGFDHQQHLGSTLGQIAFEKAGIIKRGIPVVTGPLPEEAMTVIQRVAAERYAPLIEATAHAHVRSSQHEGQTEVTVTTTHDSYGPMRLALRGEHQLNNAVVAIRLLETARREGIKVTRAGIEQGFANADWPARLEVMSLPAGRRVILDAAHNADGAAALARYLRQWYPERPALVIGVMRDKAAADILQALLPVTSQVIATAAPTPRAMPATDLAAAVTAVAPQSGVRIVADPDEAIEQALQESETVCVAGSVFLAGAVRPGLKRRAILH